MRRLDKQEVEIVRQIIRNPRISDNQVSKITKVPVMTVNRKRKQLEKEGLLEYYAHLDTTETGTGTFKIRRLYLIKFKIGITIADFVGLVKTDHRVKSWYPQFVEEAFIGEMDGHLTLMVIVGAEDMGQLIDTFNGKLIMPLKKRHGDDAIVQVISASVTFPLRVHHNYLPRFNMEKGIIREDWRDEWIFVDKVNQKPNPTQKRIKSY